MASHDRERAYIAGALSGPPLTCGSESYTPLGVKTPRQGTPDQPLVSIVTVTFNAAKMVEQAIQSVARQSYPEIEYIVIDGGSRDETLSIVRRNATHVDGLISEPDKGIYDAMNKGLRRARGRYVALLNADDQLYPDFVAHSVAALLRSDADISYCDYNTEDHAVRVADINPGLLLSQLGIKHNTFLMHRRCFEQVGGFDAHLKVVADAKWNRAAYAAGLTFEKVDGLHVFYSTRGLSSAATQADRDRIIRESTELLIDSFPQLDPDQARTLYLSNFNTHKHQAIMDLHRKMALGAPLLSEMIAEATRWNLRNRAGYRLNAKDADQTVRVIALARYFDVPLTDLVFDNTEENRTQNETIATFFKTLARAEAQKAETGEALCLHFARVFSAPSETFIYDFLQDLTEAPDGKLHVMLCDTRETARDRPFELTFHVPWNTLPRRLCETLYELIWDRLAPDTVVAHFALNGWFLHDRLTPGQRRVKWVNMCHGIDVFAYGNNPNYTAYIDQYCAAAPNVAFTVVSRFLADLLERNGVPPDKIFLVPNAVADIFATHRKTDGFWDGTRPLRIISVGRLIPWKGHDRLIEALHAVKEARPDLPVQLDIVYGRWTEQLGALTALRDRLGLTHDVTFIDYVNFREAPDFLPGYDLFVLPSTTSDDAVPRTETFGVALIEAISAGLPVIATNAGGIPEVIGTPGPQAGLVQHGQTEPLAQALMACIDAPEATFCDNAAYSQERLVHFSAPRRLENWGRVTAWLEQPRKKVFHFCALSRGGAAGASMNIHKGLLRLGYESWFVTRSTELHHFSDYAANVVGLAPETSIDFNHTEPPRRPEFTTYSLDDHLISDATLRTLLEGADLINLTWPAKFLSVQNIAMMTRLGVPVMMTLRDMNLITGGAHFFHGSTRWQHGEDGCPQRPDIAPEDYPEQVYTAKQTTWNFDAVTFVALSDHSMDILAASPLARHVPRIKLPNYVDMSVFYRDTGSLMPTLSDLPEGTIKIGYLPSFGSRVKGHRHLLRSLRHLHAEHPGLPITICLASDDAMPPEDVPFPVIRIGALNDRTALRQFYNSVDMVAVPSLEETFSNTTMEALACGVPVVGFRTGILQEVLADGVCGVCVDMEDTRAMADGILDLINAPRDPAVIVARVAETYSQDIRMQAYDTTIRKLLATPPAADPAHTIEGLQALLALTEKQQKIKARESLSRLRNMRTKLRKAEHELRKIRQGDPARVDTLEADLQKALTSRSWKVTAPLRRALHIWRSWMGHH
ncbi:MAG: glycosyltransferase [Pseudomonadota bacterium]